MNSARTHASMSCPRCEHPIGALAGAPETASGAFTADAACPECGQRIPAGSRLLAGGAYRASLRGMPKFLLAFLGFCVLMQLWLLVERLRSMAGATPAAAGPDSWRSLMGMGSQLLMVGGLGGIIAEAVLNRRIASGASRIPGSGRAVRWIFGPQGLEILERKAFRIASTTVPVETIERIEGQAIEFGRRSAPATERFAAQLTLRTRKLGPDGRCVDLDRHDVHVPLDGGADGPACATMPEAESAARRLASDLTALAGCRPWLDDRPIPAEFRDDPQSKVRSMQVAMLTGLAATFVLGFAAGVLLPSGAAWSGARFLATCAIVLATFGTALGVRSLVLRSGVRRRQAWVRGRGSASR
jgi:hypothetical protein